MTNEEFSEVKYANELIECEIRRLKKEAEARVFKLSGIKLYHLDGEKLGDTHIHPIADSGERAVITTRIKGGWADHFDFRPKAGPAPINMVTDPLGCTKGIL